MITIIYVSGNHRQNASQCISIAHHPTRNQQYERGVRNLLHSSDPITYPRLVHLRHRGLRTGSWRHLDLGQKALFRCALWITKARGRITNAKLMTQIVEIAQLLSRSFRNAVERASHRRIAQMQEKYAKPGGAFHWAPQLADWLKDARYIWYLGILEVST